ncbi:MAG: FHA domain-containing protein [Candidatus Nitronauta litoralis]|uniref:FHA domain-containing protein n=1 Tax=Candidatus Nitronauta litoralis TaxID=2705533 RepID=A0A7T0BVI4_9BACT|nr:MAG: FHA domain-containing protein [Candidatus Nitronauta litoralis]
MDRLIIETLTGQGGSGESKTIFRNGSGTIGRDFSNDLILDDPYISPKHLQITALENKILVKDLKTKNGTRVNKDRLIRGEKVEINSGDEILVGRTHLKLFLSNHPVEPASKWDRVMAFRNFIDRAWVPVVTSLGFIFVAVWMKFLENPGGNFFQKQFYPLLIGSIALVLSSPGLISLYTFAKYKKSYFVRNLVVCNLVAFISYIYTVFDPFIFFHLLNRSMVALANNGVLFLMTLGELWICVRLVKDSLKLKDFVPITVFAIAIIFLAAMGNKEISLGFQGEPKYHSRIAPGMSPFTDPKGLDEFLNAGASEFTRVHE